MGQMQKKKYKKIKIISSAIMFPHNILINIFKNLKLLWMNSIREFNTNDYGFTAKQLI